MLGRLWFYSRERRAAIKRDNSTCQVCGRQASTAKGREVKIEVDHLKGEINWKKIERVLREELLVSPAQLETICREDHRKRTNRREQDKR